MRSAPFTYVLPIGPYNSRERAMDSPAFACPIPARIPPFTQEQEEVVMQSLLSELNISYIVGLDPTLSLDSCTNPVSTVHGTGQTVFGSGSHMSNIAKVLIATGKDIVDFLVPGWCPKTANINRLASSIAEMKLSNSDTVFLELCLNCAYMGTANAGLPVAAKKLPVDGEYDI